MRMHLVLGVIAAVGLVGSQEARAIDLDAGEWEILEQSPDSDMTEAPYSMCLSDDMPVPMPNDIDDECQLDPDSIDVRGDVVTWEFTCTDPEDGSKGTGSGTATFAGDRFEGSITMGLEMAGGMEPDELTVTLKGERIGPCTE